jgi:hypothetical protein
MDSIQINSGEKRVCINDDQSRVITFNPTDALFVERFYRLLGELDEKMTEYQKRCREIEAIKTVDKNDLPANIGDYISLIKETCEYMREKTDHLFGEGTSQTAFGNALSVEAFTQFYEGITPLIAPERRKRIEKYTGTPPATSTRKRRK